MLAPILAPVVLLPFVLALVPVALPVGVSPRRLAACATLCAGLGLALALVCAVPVDVPWLFGESTGIWRQDAWSRSLATLPAFSWALICARAWQPGEFGRSSAERWRRWPVSGQLATAATMALCRVELLAMLPLLLGVLLGTQLLAVPRGALAAGRDRVFALSALPVMAIGVAVLSAAIGAPARWATLQPAASAGGAQTVGLVLLLAPVLIVSVAATLQPALQSGRQTGLRGLFRVCLMLAALVVVLRSGRAAPLSPLLWWFGTAAIVLSLLLLPACRGLPARLALAVALQNGVALIALALGGAGGIAAAVMILGFLALLLPMVLWFPLDRGSARLRRLAVMVMVGLPPFGPFAAGAVLLVRVSAAMPLVAALLLLAAALSAISVLDAAMREPAPSAETRVTAWFGCAAITLLSLLWLGLAMPSTLSDRLVSIGEAGP